MDYITNLNNTISGLEQQIAKNKEELEILEKDFSDVKLNPYGITNIDFSKRQELIADSLKMEGAIMGLNLAKENFQASDGSTQTTAPAS
jgi:hypothetical protein